MVDNDRTCVRMEEIFFFLVCKNSDHIYVELHFQINNDRLIYNKSSRSYVKSLPKFITKRNLKYSRLKTSFNRSSSMYSDSQNLKEIQLPEQ